mmetsp:Transcript_13082/g.24579  ORF Transcript_13082/g.24579 Transcript_13082/m.24579 type:complete len:212 (+) Transcript_13082:4981-5616(+)
MFHSRKWCRHLNLDNIPFICIRSIMDKTASISSSITSSFTSSTATTTLLLLFTTTSTTTSTTLALTLARSRLTLIKINKSLMRLRSTLISWNVQETMHILIQFLPPRLFLGRFLLCHPSSSFQSISLRQGLNRRRWISHRVKFQYPIFGNDPICCSNIYICTTSRSISLHRITCTLLLLMLLLLSPRGSYIGGFQKCLFPNLFDIVQLDMS